MIFTKKWSLALENLKEVVEGSINALVPENNVITGSTCMWESTLLSREERAV